jgi:hypothetical protein
VRLGSLRHRAALALRLAAAWRPTGRRLRALLRATFTSYLAIGGMLWILPNLHAGGPLSVLSLVLTTFAVGAVLRPLLVAVAVVFGSAGLLLGGVLTQAIVLDVALEVAPNVHPGPFRDVVLASWLVAAISALVNWVFDVGSDEAFLARVLGRAAREARLDPRAVGEPGLLVVQIDGLGEDVLRQAIAAGAVPTLSRWLRRGSHVLHPWWTGLPATTPAAQAAILHGDVRAVPGFRWYEKETGRLLIANRPRDAAEMEERVSDGRGLLADGGVSVANLFSGDAPVRLLTMSDPRLSPQARRGLADFLSGRGGVGGLPRSLVQMAGVMLTELQQGRRQRRRDVRPRVDRRSVFVLLRAVTTVLLRNAAVTLVADQLAAGAPVLFVDFVDYDEVAHHAGPSRPEAIRTLDGIDRVLELLGALAGRVNRRYEIAVLSDHGQAQGPTFRQEAGRTLDELVGDLVDADVPATGSTETDAAPAERWGPANLLLTGLARRRTRRAEKAYELGPGRRGSGGGRRPMVVASGNLAHVYLPEVPGRAVAEQIEAAHPRLLKGLREHPQIGVVLVRAADGTLRALGRDGWRSLADGTGDGADPLAPYGPKARDAVCQLDTRDHVGDLVLLGRADPALGEVVAFEELVGSHGGLGGGQNQAILVVPRSWDVPAEPLDGLAVHRLLLDRLERLGLRR